MNKHTPANTRDDLAGIDPERLPDSAYKPSVLSYKVPVRARVRVRKYYSVANAYHYPPGRVSVSVRVGVRVGVRVRVRVSVRVRVKVRLGLVLGLPG